MAPAVFDSVVVDVGQTGTRVWAHGSGGHRELAGPGYEQAATAEAATALAVRTALSPLGEVTAHALAIGSTGFRGARPQAGAVVRELGPGVRARRWVIADDSVSAYLGVIGRRSGVAVVAGTGAVALATDGARRCAHVDGYGALLGDAGGGFWLGRAGVRLALRELDGRPGGSPTMLARLRRHFGGADVRRRVREWPIASATVREVAALAPIVLAAAEEGDRKAAVLVDEAGRLLADSAVAALRRAQVALPAPAVLVGGLVRASDRLPSAFAAALAHHLGPGTCAGAAAEDAVAVGTRRLLDDAAAEAFPELVDTWHSRAP